MTELNKITFLPFCDHSGNYSYQDSYIAQLYRRVVRDGTVGNVFYDGSIQNTNDFVEFFKDKNNEIYVLFYDEREAGFFWLNSFRQRTSFISYCIFKDFWGQKALDIVHSGTSQILNRKNEFDEYITDVLLNLTPVNNKWGINFLTKAGLAILCKIPQCIVLHGGTVEEGVLFYITRESNSGVKGITSKFLNLLQK